MKKNLLKKSFLRGVISLLLFIVGNGNLWGAEVSFDASAQGYENAQEIESATITDGITVTFNKGTNNNTSKYYKSGTAIRSYGGSYFTVTSTIGSITKIELTFGTSDGSNTITTDNGTFATNTWTGEAESITFTIGGTSGHRRIKVIKVTYTESANLPELNSIEISGTPTITEYYVGDAPSEEGLVVTATYSDESTKQVTPTWTFSPETIEEGTNKVTATATYGGKTADYTYSITTKTIANTSDAPYTIAKAIELIDAGKGLSAEVYVTGIISQVESYNEAYKSITYWISEDGSTEGLQFQCYSGKDIDGEDFSSITDLSVGDAVVVKGNMQKYGNNYQFNYNNEIVSRTVKEISSIAITGEPTTSYVVGDAPVAIGLIVTATFNDGSTADVTNNVEWSFSPETLVKETTRVTATATYREKTAEFEFDVIVNDAPITYTLDFTTNNSITSSSTSEVIWDAVVAEVKLSKGESSTSANNYIGGTGTYVHTRMYKGQVLTITPKTQISKIVLKATTADYAKNEKTFNNATSTVKDTEVIINPTDGTQPVSITFGLATRFTEMVIYYQHISVEITDAGIATFCLPYNAEIPEGVTAYTATKNGTSIKLTAKEGGIIAADEGVILKAVPGTYEFTASAGEATATEGNLMVGVTEDTNLTAEDNAYLLTIQNDGEGLAFRLLATDYTLAANKAYLKLENSEARQLIPVEWDGESTGINRIEGQQNAGKQIIYNLAGQKLNQAQKGINIINGKLVIK